MAETFTKSIQTPIQSPLVGLESADTCQIRPLEPMTLMATANRFLKFSFPPQRDYELCLQLIGKGLLSPQLSRSQLETLPLKTLETLAQLVLETSTRAVNGTEIIKGNVMLDTLLTLIIAVEETWQYDLLALMSEDLALLEAHQKGSLHGYFFRPSNNWELLNHVLQSQDYLCALEPDTKADISPNMAYWLCRRLTVVFPWTGMLAHFPREKAEIFPYLFRLYKIKEYLQQEVTLLPDLSPEAMVISYLPQIRHWLADPFPRLSQEAHVARPLRELVLVEGSTEELLIPAIARALGHDLVYEGIMVQAVGGKNQMLQQYVNYAEQLNVPISIVLDKDAQPLLPDLAYYQRDEDHIYILEEGEFEDIYAIELIVKTINEFYQPTHPVTVSSLRKMDLSVSRVKTLQTLWQDLGLGLFDKVEFAQRLAETLNQERLVSPPMKRLVEKIIGTRQHAKPSL